MTASRWGTLRPSSRASALGVGESPEDIRIEFTGGWRATLRRRPDPPDHLIRSRAQEAPERLVTLPVAMLQEADFGMRDRIFYELARDLSSSLEVEVVLERVMDRVISLMKASRGFIVLVDATGIMSVQMSGG